MKWRRKRGDMPEEVVRAVASRAAREHGSIAIDALETSLEELERYRAKKFTTDELGDFWQAATEACVLRLVRLKPEMVRHISEHGEFQL